MNQRPSQRVNEFIHTLNTCLLSQDYIIAHLSTMRDQLEKEEAEAYKSIQCLIKYVGIKEAI